MSDETAAARGASFLPEFPPEDNVPARVAAAPQGRVSEIPVEIQAVIGKAKVSVAQLVAAREGSQFKLDRHFGDPVELQVNGQTIGYGEIIADERDNVVGIRMTSVEPFR